MASVKHYYVQINVSRKKSKEILALLLESI